MAVAPAKFRVQRRRNHYSVFTLSNLVGILAGKKTLLNYPHILTPEGCSHILFSDIYACMKVGKSRWTYIFPVLVHFTIGIHQGVAVDIIGACFSDGPRNSEGNRAEQQIRRKTSYLVNKWNYCSPSICQTVKGNPIGPYSSGPVMAKKPPGDNLTTLPYPTSSLKMIESR